MANVASSMECNSHPGIVNSSQNTFELVKDTFECEYRGKIDVKHRGLMKMYFVNERKKVTSQQIAMETQNYLEKSSEAIKSIAMGR